MSTRMRRMFFLAAILSGGVLFGSPTVVRAFGCEVGKDCDGCPSTCCPGQYCGCYCSSGECECDKTE